MSIIESFGGLDGFNFLVGVLNSIDWLSDLLYDYRILPVIYFAILAGFALSMWKLFKEVL